MDAPPNHLAVGASSLALLAALACVASEPVEARPGAGKSVGRSIERVHVVERGDTLSSIARRHSVTTSQLQFRNKLANPHLLQVGMRLKIPGRGLVVPRSSRTDRHRFIWPLERLDVTSEFGERKNRHRGIDLRAPRGTGIRAAADGVVQFVGRQRAYGKVVVLRHANNVRTLYAHNERNLVRKGQRVRKGEIIATVGRTGNASGYHVHFEFIESGRQRDPRRHVGIDPGYRAVARSSTAQAKPEASRTGH